MRLRKCRVKGYVLALNSILTCNTAIRVETLANDLNQSREGIHVKEHDRSFLV